MNEQLLGAVLVLGVLVASIRIILLLDRGLSGRIEAFLRSRRRRRLQPRAKRPKYMWEILNMITPAAIRSRRNRKHPLDQLGDKRVGDVFK